MIVKCDPLSFTVATRLVFGNIPHSTVFDHAYLIDVHLDLILTETDATSGKNLSRKILFAICKQMIGIPNMEILKHFIYARRVCTSTCLVINLS